jgi:MFS family permease
MFLGMFVALAVSSVDAVWNLSLRQFGQVVQRVGTAVLVGTVGGLLGGMVGQFFFGVTGSGLFRILGWTLTGMLIGTSVGVFELLTSILRQQEVESAKRKLLKGLIGGTLGGLLGGTLATLLESLWHGILRGDNPEHLFSPTATGFIALGMCIGLLIGLAQVMLKEAWLKVESGRRAGREIILSKERTTLGRAESCDVGLFGDNQIERQHAAIVLQGSRYYLEDGSTPAGTFVNDERAVGRVPLKSGDLIRLGGTVICFRERGKRR